jgi:SagB-type dehydrogenase family enzyme
LELLSPEVDERSIDEAFGQGFTLAGALTVILSAVVERSFRKYRERAYRFALLEAGHIAQSLCLAAAASGISAAPLGGFHDEQLAKAFFLRTSLEVPIYALALG